MKKQEQNALPSVPSSAGLIAMLLLVLVIEAGCDSRPRYADPVPLGVTLEGDTLTTADLRGDVSLVVLWASWCGPCRYVLTGVDSVWSEFSPQGGFRVVGVSLDSNRDSLVSYLGRHAVSFPVTWDVETKSASALGIRGIPTYVLFDAAGDQRWKYVGVPRSTDTLRAVVTRYLRERVKPPPAPGGGHLANPTGP